MLERKPSDTQIDASKKNKDIRKPVDKDSYQRLIRNLIYLSHIRQNICNVQEWKLYIFFVQETL